MYSIKNKIDLFNKMVYEKNKDDKEKEIKSLNENYETKLKALKENEKKRREEEIKKVKEETEREKKQIISKAKVQAQKKLLEEHGEILEKFNKYIYENIEQYLNTEKYKTYLKKEINQVEKDILESDDIEIFLRKKDQELIDLSRFKINYTGEIIGGFYIIKNKKIKYDCTLKAKIEENSDYIGYLIMKILNSKNDEEGVNFEH